MRLAVATLLLLVASPLSLSAQDWGPWRAANSCRGLDYRVYSEQSRVFRDQTVWYLEFRNNYSERINFQYNYTPTREDSLARDEWNWMRASIAPGGTHFAGSRTLPIRAGGSVWIHLYPRFRFGPDSGPFVRCP